MPPFRNIEKPTEQAGDVQDLLSFLPEVLVTCNNGFSVTKSRLIKEVGTGLKFSAQQGRNFTEKELVKMVSQLVDSMINLDFMTELANNDGFHPDENAARIEINKLRSEMDDTEFNAMLNLQGISELQFSERISKKIMLDSWIKERRLEDMKVSKQEIKIFYEANRSIFLKPEEVRFSQILVKWDHPKPPEATHKTRELLNEILSQNKRGEDFRELAACRTLFRHGATT